MSYQSFMVGLNNYIIEFDVDFSKEIDINDVTDGISFSIYSDTPDINSPNGYTKITSFENTTFILSNQYTEEIVNYENGDVTTSYLYSSIPSQSSSITVTQLLFQECVDGVFTFYLKNNPINSNDGISRTIKFDSGVTYNLELNLNSLFADETIDNIYSFKFITTSSETQSVTYNSYPNNILTSINKLDSIKDVDTVLDLNSDLNYQFVSTDNNMMQFDINSTLESLYIKQYLSEYVSYFESMNEANTSLDDLTRKQLIDLKKILLKNSNLVNASFKGNEQGMAMVFNIFCEALGQYLLNLEPSPVLHNFTYRITTSLPKEYWLGDIKNIIHPVSWKDEYVYVDIVSSVQNLWFDNRKNIPTKICTSYLDISNKDRFRMYPDIFDLSIFEDYHSQHKFNFNVNKYIVDVAGYYDQELLDMLTDIDMFEVTYSLSEYWINLNSEYKFNGVALEYEFVVKIRGNVYQTYNTFTPNIQLTLPYSAEDFSVEVTLTNNNFTTVIPAKSFSINTLEDIGLFDNTSLSMFTYKINEFVSYEWIILDTDEISIINTITTATNYVDVLEYVSKYLSLRVHYSDGYSKIVNSAPYLLI